MEDYLVQQNCHWNLYVAAEIAKPQKGFSAETAWCRYFNTVSERINDQKQNKTKTQFKLRALKTYRTRMIAKFP